MRGILIKRTAGVGLVELMIAMALAMLLMLAVIQVYIPSLRTNDLNSGVSQVQEKARYLSQFLSKDIRMVGYSGCMTRADIVVNNGLKESSKAAWEYGNDIFSLLVNGTLPTGGSGVPNFSEHLTSDPTPLDGNSLLFITTVEGAPVSLVPPKTGANLTIEDNGDSSRSCADGGTSLSGVCVGDILLIADCYQARFLQATNVTQDGSNIKIVHAASGNPGNDLTSWGDNTGETYNSDAEIIRSSTLTYFIADNPEGIPTLYRKTDADAALEMATHVYSFRTLYGVDTNGQKEVTAYQDESSVLDWDDVVSVRIELLIGSDDSGLIEDPQSFSLNFGNDAQADMPDTRYYQLVRSSIVLRNRAR